MMNIKAVLFVLAFPTLGFADSICEPTSNLLQRNPSCEENQIFSQAAESCLAKVEDKIAQSREKLSGKLGQKVLDLSSNEKQGQAYKSQVEGLDAARKNLSENIRLVKRVLREFEEYRLAMRSPFHWPKDQPAPDRSDEGYQEFLESEGECYAQPSFALRAAKQRAEKMLADLTAARGEAEVDRNSTAGSKKNLDREAGDNRKIVKKGESASGVKRKQGWGKSGISESKKKVKE